MNGKILVAPSVLSADFSKMEDAVRTIVNAQADWIHLDVMDGSFVPVITFGPKLVKDIRPLTDKPFDVHLMTMHPESFITDFATAGADFITFHYEAALHAHRIIEQIRDSGCKPGISIVPSTPVSVLSEILKYVDLVLVMTVNPGFGGQKIIQGVIPKITELKNIRIKENLEYFISVDGGVNRSTSKLLTEAGADILISGSAFFNSDNPIEEIRYFKG